MFVEALWQYPVKSMIGFVVDTAQVEPLGMVGDRVIALRDVERGHLANTRQTPSIMQLAVSRGHETLDIQLPDGTSISIDDPTADERLSSFLGRAVRVEHLRPASDLEYFRRRPDPSAPSDVMEHLRTIFARDADEPLPDFSKFGPAVVEFESPPGTFVDCFPLLLMSTSALRSMADSVPGAAIDVRRFRPNIVVDTGSTIGHPEFEWQGRHLQLGSVVLEVVNDCPRCAAITKKIDDQTPEDRRILRHVVRDLGQSVGVYCTVVTPGTVSVGDEVQLID